MDILIPKLYRDYGFYDNQRQLPLDLDGLIPAERRILFAADLIAKNKFVKSAKVDGYTTGNFHPHGSVYSTIVQLVRQGFLDGQGNFGCDYGVQEIGFAAMRYTEVKLSNFTKEMAFKYLDNVQWQINDLGEKEPLFLPTMFPFCLCGTKYTSGIGFGFRTTIPCYKVNDLKKRLLWLLGITKEEPIIKPITDCKILSDDTKLKNLLTTGKESIEVEGIIQEYPGSHKVILKSWPYGKQFGSILNKFATELENQDIGFNDLSVNSTEIEFQVLKQRNRDVIYDAFVKKLKKEIKGLMHFEINVMNLKSKTKVHLKSVDKLLLDTYKLFHNINQIMLKSEKDKIINIIHEYNLLVKIRPHLANYISKNKGKPFHSDEAIKEISNSSKVKEDDVKSLVQKYRINKLLSIDGDTSSLQEEIQNIDKNIKEIDKFVLEQYKKLEASF